MRIKEFLFTAFYAGHSPVAPGTAGTLVGMALYFIVFLLSGEISWVVNLIAVVALFYPFMKLADDGERYFGVKDPEQVVIDEIMGYWISVLFYPFNIKIAVAAFFVFRFFDILKPWPAGKLQSLRGGLGIMIDDCVAGVYTNLILLAAVLVLKLFHVDIY
ncbi:MAG TPA: phosphatidylglycerophosphatase A [Spirochaetota bacterium]|nr:phosphatidylglycerophosphatase A [Spirochaetota bacterium]HPC40529.1 phosphatidylglycerophosphatase A [Spirochaetota bacterium]HPL18402.1 phosphatidylglycerophosphatase A [Spirochaetota bacterium]HQF07963.1 phosphatidylglycerophosphatase A [Spirochaetota bacterium]HQH96523.1 phosphatidylglycerophosphatase A [Spirochaetota bacterium]